MARQTVTVRQVAEELGVKPAWVRKRIADGTVKATRSGSKGKGRYKLTRTDLDTLRVLAAQQAQAPGAAPDDHSVDVEDAPADAALARITKLEADRANLLAQVAWARAMSQEQQKALEYERDRAEKLSADLDVQRARIEALKALSAWDRVRGRHKAI